LGKHSQIRSIWLCFPNAPRPFLEILGYTPSEEAHPRAITAPGWGHIALEVADLGAQLDAVQRLGGSLQGQVTTLQGPEHRFQIAFVRDPEGNVIELEQRADG
jgi:catechol 2,3-dioxygenase-like lactoylglutathione lyase family enzyme